MIERGNFLCAGYASMHGYASKIRLRVPVLGVFCCGAWMIERGNFICAGYASTRGYHGSKLRLGGTGVRGVLPWSLDDRTRDFVMCWLRVYAWLHVKINSKVSGVRGV